MRKRYGDHPGKGWLATLVLYVFSRIYTVFRYRVHFEGGENLPKTGAVLLLAKHQRLDDIPLGMMVIHRHCRKDIWCVMKDDLNAPWMFGFFLRTGGIPINRKNPEKSKQQLLMARHVLHDDNLVVLFPEQTFFPGKMGRGKTPGFRFIAGRPEKPLHVIALGFRYKKTGLRTDVFIRIGKPVLYDAKGDPGHFLHDRMHEMAELSLLTYPYERPEKETAGAAAESA